MANLPPSRRDNNGPPRKDGIVDLGPLVRHHGSYLESLDPGILGGRFATPRPVGNGPGTPLLVGTESGGDGAERLWEYDDRHTVTAVGTQTPRLSHEPFEESLFVRWHPAGRGGYPITSEFFTVEDQTVIIPDTGLLAVGDQFSFQYEYEDTEDALDFQFIAVVGSVFHSPANTLTFTPPVEMEAGDFLVVACRGTVAPGGGDVIDGFSNADARTSLLYTATPPVRQCVFTGFATNSLDDVVVNVVPALGFLPSAKGVMGIFRGINALGPVSSIEAGGITPVVAAQAAIAVTWDGNHSFTVLQAVPPSGYTEGGSTGLDYSSTDLSYWSDPSAEDSLAGTYSGEGVIIIGVT